MLQIPLKGLGGRLIDLRPLTHKAANEVPTFLAEACRVHGQVGLSLPLQEEMVAPARCRGEGQHGQTPCGRFGG